MRLALQRESEPLWFSVIVAPERVGRWIMDFGFGSLVDKFEERIGRRATSALLWLAAVALFVTCARAIILDGLVPLLDFVRGVSSESALSFFGSIVLGAIVAVVSGVIFAAVVSFIVRRVVGRYVMRANEHVKRAEQITLETKELNDRLVRAISKEEKRLGLD